MMFDQLWLEFLRRNADFPFDHPPITQDLFDVTLPKFNNITIRLISAHEFFWLARYSCMCSSPHSLSCISLAHIIAHYWVIKITNYINEKGKDFYIYDMSIPPRRKSRNLYRTSNQNEDPTPLMYPPNRSSRTSHPI
ncbi:hypothetical protein ORF14 [Aviadenovirus bubonis]|nr:hypothetical protein ORF14 [Owl adenovirus]